MRDPNRIKPFLDELEKSWKLNPDLRFGQLIYSLNHSIRPNDGDTFNIEDNEYLEYIKEAIKNDSFDKILEVEYLDKISEEDKDFFLRLDKIINRYNGKRN